MLHTICREAYMNRDYAVLYPVYEDIMKMSLVQCKLFVMRVDSFDEAFVYEKCHTHIVPLYDDELNIVYDLVGSALFTANYLSMTWNEVEISFYPDHVRFSFTFGEDVPCRYVTVHKDVLTDEHSESGVFWFMPPLL